MIPKFINREEVNYYAVADEDYKGSYPCPSIKIGDVIRTDEEHVNETLESGEHAFNYEENNHWCIALLKAHIVKETISHTYEILEPEIPEEDELFDEI